MGLQRLGLHLHPVHPSGREAGGGTGRARLELYPARAQPTTARASQERQPQYFEDNPNVTVPELRYQGYYIPEKMRWTCVLTNDIIARLA